MKSKKDYPFIIVGAENCERCTILQKHIPEAEMIKIPNRSLGFGDSFAKLTYILSITSCRSCKIRRSFLNKIFPYVWNASKEVRKMDKKELKIPRSYKSVPVQVRSPVQ